MPETDGPDADDARPNLLLTGADSRAAERLARRLEAAGWALPGADAAWAEHPGFREVNQALKGGGHPDAAIEALLDEAEGWPRPWLLKDPRLLRPEILSAWSFALGRRGGEFPALLVDGAAPGEAAPFLASWPGGRADAATLLGEAPSPRPSPAPAPRISAPAAGGPPAVLVHAHDRPAKLDALLRTIRARRSDMAVLVSDDSKAPALRRDVAAHVVLPPDAGLSAGRNALLALCRAGRFLLCDDDYEFTARTDVGALERALDAGYDLVGGSVIEASGATGPQAKWMWREGAKLVLAAKPRTGKAAEKAGVVRCDFVRNFWLARTEAVRRIGGWDATLKLGEHEDFFLRAQEAGLAVGLAPAVEVLHRRGGDGAAYRADRVRAAAYQREWLARRGLVLELR